MFLLHFLLVTSVLQLSYTASIQDEYKTYKGYKLYRVVGDSQEILKLIKMMNQLAEIPFYDARGARGDILIAPELVQIFEERVRLANLQANVEIGDYSEIIRSEKTGSRRKGSDFSWTAYYDVDDIYKYLQNVSKSHPDSTELVVGGQTYEGRQILGLRINTPSENKSDNKPVVFIESGIHAREWITPATTTYFINELLTSNNPDVTALRDQFDWHIFPTVNPDGYHYSMTRDRMWRKTRSKSSTYCYGADPNRNWDHNWLQHGATNNPCDYQTYGGSKPFSEVETRTLSEYIASLENLLAYVAFHSDAQILLVPYSDSVEHTDNYDDLVQIGKTSLEYGRQVNGEEYGGPATAAEILYKASGGSMDWVREKLGTPIVYTYELRGSYFHWPAEKINEQGDEVTQMLLGLFKEAKNLGYY
ncbi:zinc carboxypeptidase-like [Ostrinia nubilalis]|uniref:zinc carboxypeptidase-like n=1 Tax=Ostrinia nubilalis TaxID=29057 RepID=UPI0030823D1E